MKSFKEFFNFFHKHKKGLLILFVSAFFVVSGFILFWVSTFKVPDLSSFNERIVSQSTKIYDRTGKILLYDVFNNKKRKIIPFEQISKDIKNATVAIEDATFYEHGGIRIKSILRSVLVNIVSGGFSQGGSTITQQVVKNSILTTEKTISRKLKEWFLSTKIESVMSKDEILSIYLNENPYGGSIYGVEEASQAFFGKSASEVDLAEAAYLAAIPKAPTFFSPYGQNKNKLDERQKLVLSKMLENKFINKDDYEKALQEKVSFKPKEQFGIKAPHFVEFVRSYLADKYGEESLLKKGYKVITTLDYDLQEKSEEIVKKYAEINEKNFKATNASVVAVDPKTGQILTMVGSRDYFDKKIDGNFNVALAHRQPGSTFKPFVYATAFKKGYTPDTVLFDVPTEFQTTCTPEGLPINPDSKDACYMPENYDGQYLGPISLRDALAQSRNIPSIKALYLAGIKDSIQTARDMGIRSLSNDPNQYGLTLVLGGGEVSLLDLTSAYSVFANDGVRNQFTGILSVEDSSGNIIEKFEPSPRQVLDSNVSELISDVLSDTKAKVPAYGLNSPLYFPGHVVADKTGTTNDYRDAWTVGYTPEISLGAWVGNNDNSPMEKKVAGLIVSPMWSEIMNYELTKTKGEVFNKPKEIDDSIKPVLRGLWQGNETFFVDRISGKLATEATPKETRAEISINNIHSILYWVDKNDPLGPQPSYPDNDPQFSLWEYSIQKWLLSNPQVQIPKPTTYDNVHTEANRPKIVFSSPKTGDVFNKDSKINVSVSILQAFPIKKVNYFLNDNLIGSSETFPFSFSFAPSSIDFISNEQNTLKAVVYDIASNKNEVETKIFINDFDL